MGRCYDMSDGLLQPEGAPGEMVESAKTAQSASVVEWPASRLQLVVVGQEKGRLSNPKALESKR